jgi:hypothetical protein
MLNPHNYDYFFDNEKLYKIIEKSKKYYKVVQIQPKTIDNEIYDEMHGRSVICYNLYDIDIKNSFNVLPKMVKNINWLDKIDEDHLKNNVFLFNTITLYDKIHYNSYDMIPLIC